MSLEISTETTFLLDMINESYGPVLNVSNCENGASTLAYTTFGSATPTGFDAISDGGAVHAAGTADEISIEDTKRYFVEFTEVLNSGTAPFFNINLGLSGASGTSEGAQLSVNGANSFTFTATATFTGVVRFRVSSTATNFEITNLSIRQVL